MTVSTSSHLKKTQFTYKTFRRIELLKYSRCCQLNNFCCVFTGLEKRVMGSREHMHQFWFFVYTAWKETHLTLQCLGGVRGDGGAAMPRLLLLSGPRKEKHGHGPTEKMWHFPHFDTSHLQIDVLYEIDRRRYNESASVTQRYAIRALWDFDEGAFLTSLLFIKHGGPPV